MRMELNRYFPFRSDQGFIYPPPDLAQFRGGGIKQEEKERRKKERKRKKEEKKKKKEEKKRRKKEERGKRGKIKLKKREKEV